jgi:hypothetical protein
VSTGFGRTSAAVGMFEPVTMTHSASAAPGERRHSFLSQCGEGKQQTHCRHAPSRAPDERRFDDNLLSLNLPRFSKLFGKQQAFSQK